MGDKLALVFYAGLRMQLSIFIVLNFLILIIRTLLAIPLIVFKNFLPFLNRRINFERQNIFSSNSRSFRADNIKSDFLFHISSEGELEQIRSVLEFFLAKSYRIEIIFTSESVEKKCLQLVENNPLQIRIFRLPLLSFFPFNFLYFQSIWSWATSPVIILCRYDFFPELLAFKVFKKKLILLSAATKNNNWYKKECFKLFDYIIAANISEKIQFEKIVDSHKSIDVFDFRIPRIYDRIDHSREFISKYPELVKMSQFLSSNSELKTLIMGSAWESDINILSHSKIIEDLLNKKLYILIAPHKLNIEQIQIITKKISDLIDSSHIGVLNREDEWKFSPITIITIPGILCELYTLFTMSYIGGGFEKSIHSVLEPFLSGSKVICGPKTHRSTEFDFILTESQDEIISINNSVDFYDTMIKLNKTPPHLQMREILKEKNGKNQLFIIQKIESMLRKHD